MLTENLSNFSTYNFSNTTTTPEEFVAIWQTSQSVGEVCVRTGHSNKTVSDRAYRYRRNGVPLKRFVERHRRYRNDYDALARFARTVEM